MSQFIPSWVRKNVRCVCVLAGNDWEQSGPRHRTRRVPGPRCGDIVTIAGHRFDRVDGWCLILKEWPIRTWFGLRRDGYAIGAFRPLISRKTMAEDVALIKSHLKAPPALTTTRERHDA